MMNAVRQTRGAQNASILTSMSGPSHYGADIHGLIEQRVGSRVDDGIDNKSGEQAEEQRSCCKNAHPELHRERHGPDVGVLR